MRKPLLVALIFAVAVPSLAVAQQEQEEGAKWEWLPRPSLRIGDVFRADFRVKLHGDWRWFPDELEPEDGTFTNARRRFGVEGRVGDAVEYEVEYEFAGEGAWTDVYANVRYFRNLQVRGGKFKVPFSLDQLTGITTLDFIYRTAIGRDLAPGREVGAVAHGRVLDRSLALGYEAGVFRHDGERARFGENPGAGTTVAGRVTLQPFRAMSKDAPLRELQLGAAVTSGDVPEGPGPNSLRARTVGGAPMFYEVYVNGRRTRLGTEAAWEPGPYSIKGEFVQIWDSRNAQGILGDDLPRVGYRGWYVSGSWVVTGEQKSSGVEPRKPFLHGGLGAVELAARYEWAGFGSAGPPEEPETNPRAINLVETGTGAWTAGVNWYLNRWVRLQFNAIRESFDDVSRSPVPGESRFWSGACRLQFVM